jgi:hypothetical protein
MDSFHLQGKIIVRIILGISSQVLNQYSNERILFNVHRYLHNRELQEQIDTVEITRIPSTSISLCEYRHSKLHFCVYIMVRIPSGGC